MKVVYSRANKLHDPPREFVDNTLVPYAESPDRADVILDALKTVAIEAVIAPTDHGMGPILRVHAAHYLEYLAHAYEHWLAAGLPPEGIMPEFYAKNRHAGAPRTRSPQGRAGWYMTDSSAMIVAGTWPAAVSAVDSALTGADLVIAGERAAFALCRPPGHHAGHDFGGGYCFLNNAAIAAAHIRERTHARVCIFDIDFHHGNGTQDIVARHDGLHYVSIHGDPDLSYPYLTGFRDENTDRIANFPFRENITNDVYFEVFREAVWSIRESAPAFLIISLGVDTHESDPIGTINLTSDFYTTLASYITAELPLPTLVVMEGGYHTASLGGNVANFISPLAR